MATLVELLVEEDLVEVFLAVASWSARWFFLRGKAKKIATAVMMMTAAKMSHGVLRVRCLLSERMRSFSSCCESTTAPNKAASGEQARKKSQGEPSPLANVTLVERVRPPSRPCTTAL